MSGERVGPDPEAAVRSPDGGTSSTDVPVERPVALVPSRGRFPAPFDPFRRYMAEISRYPPLTREEEQDLARQYRETGDESLLFRLIAANLMLVVRIALGYRRAARSLLDLIQEGNVGLLQAIERFDPELGVRLPTYAAYWIRAYMVKFLLDNVRLVRVGTTNARRKLLRNLRREKEKLERSGFEVGPRLLAEHFGVSQADVEDVERALASREISLDAPVSQGDERPAEEVIADPRSPDVEEQVARRELRERFEAVIGPFREGLSERDRALLDDRILSDSPQTLQAIGDRFGTTREAARQAESRLLARLKELVERDLGDLAQVRTGRRR
jgi:RNA polymerase sigma-32 factor